MTFKELLDKYQFSDILAEVRSVSGNVSGFKMAFDCLKSLAPKPGKGTVDIMTADRGESDPYVRVMGLSEDRWENGLSKQIKIHGDANVAEKAILAHCLWEITYFGYSQKKVEEKFHGFRNRWVERNQYDKMLHDLIIRNFRKRVKPKNRRYSKDGGVPLFHARNEEELNKYLFSPKKTNRRKRKAEKRYRERRAYLERMSKRTEMIKKLAHDDSTFSFKDLEFILTMAKGQEITYESFPTPSSNRAAYLEDLILNYEDYSNLEVEDATDIVVFAESSKATPVSPEEGERLRAIFSKLYPTARIHYGQATNDSAGSEILLSINFIDR